MPAKTYLTIRWLPINILDIYYVIFVENPMLQNVWFDGWVEGFVCFRQYARYFA